MKISEMIDQLQAIQAKHGDLKIIGGYISDDIPPKKVAVLNKDGCDFYEYGGEIEGAFII